MSQYIKVYRSHPISPLESKDSELAPIDRDIIRLPQKTDSVV